RTCPTSSAAGEPSEQTEVKTKRGPDSALLASVHGAGSLLGWGCSQHVSVTDESPAQMSCPTSQVPVLLAN
ncbi:hypothetical protein, partial [Streptomyces sp. NPDC060027]|uniref:hypothetical protein n=1 Tax=Streptomyces sp. NPDC060027 TaxID=3347040 RepID=UPI0036BFCA98